MSLTGSAELDALVPIAARLSAAVHDQDAETVRDLLAARTSPEQLRQLVVLLAAMLPDDLTPRESLAWLAAPDEYARLRAEGVSTYAANILIQSS